MFSVLLKNTQFRGSEDKAEGSLMEKYVRAIFWRVFKSHREQKSDSKTFHIHTVSRCEYNILLLSKKLFFWPSERGKNFMPKHPVYGKVCVEFPIECKKKSSPPREPPLFFLQYLTSPLLSAFEKYMLRTIQRLFHSLLFCLNCKMGKIEEN
jgi:hypothetical protein